jgi:hypothetical protein
VAEPAGHSCQPPHGTPHLLQQRRPPCSMAATGAGRHHGLKPGHCRPLRNSRNRCGAIVMASLWHQMQQTGSFDNCSQIWLQCSKPAGAVCTV